MRRFLTLASTVAGFLVAASANSLVAQDEKKAEAPPAEAKKEEAKPAEPKKEGEAPAPAPAEAKKDAGTPAPAAPKPIPPEVEAKLEAARKAVAEAVAAAEAAGLVDSSIDPPPILDILVYGRADDKAELSKPKDQRKGISPEVFGAWFAGQGKIAGLNFMEEVRIFPPGKGLVDLYTLRAAKFNPHLEAARKALKEAGAAAKPAEEKKAEEAPKPAEEPKKEEAPKAEEPKPAEAPKAEEPKPAEEPKAEEPKPAEAPKAEEPKKDGR